MLTLDNIAIGKRIKQVRGALSQEKFAELLGVGRASLARYELGHRPPDLEFVNKLYILLDIDPVWLMSGKHSDEQKPMNAELRNLMIKYQASDPIIRDVILKILA